jgi:hypothetical protein
MATESRRCSGSATCFSLRRNAHRPGPRGIARLIGALAPCRQIHYPFFALPNLVKSPPFRIVTLEEDQMTASSILTTLSPSKG